MMSCFVFVEQYTPTKLNMFEAFYLSVLYSASSHPIQMSSPFGAARRYARRRRETLRRGKGTNLCAAEQHYICMTCALSSHVYSQHAFTPTRGPW